MEGKTKNDYFQEMLKEVMDWGVKPRIVTGDSWYSGVENLKFLRNQKLGFLFWVEKKGGEIRNEDWSFQSSKSPNLSAEFKMVTLKQRIFVGHLERAKGLVLVPY